MTRIICLAAVMRFSSSLFCPIRFGLSSSRYPNMCCEVLTCDIWAFCEALFANRDLLQNFWAFLKNPPPLNPLLASYFSKVFSHLLHKKTAEVCAILRRLLVCCYVMVCLWPQAIPRLELPVTSNTSFWVGSENLEFL
jgi:hypothetical protein